MSNGHIEQVNTPIELYAQPNSRFVFDFLGNVNRFEASWQQNRWTNGDAFLVPPEQAPLQQNGALYVRSHELALADKPNSQAHIPFTIVAITPVGAEVRVELAPIGWQSEELCYFFAEQGDGSPIRQSWPFLPPGSLVFDI